MLKLNKPIAGVVTAALLFCSFLPVRAATAYPRFDSAGEASYTNVIDTSHYDTVTSWTALRQNTSVVYIKATQRTDYTDPKCDYYAVNAAESRLDFGFYHFFEPGTVDNARAQADYFYSTIKGYAYTCLPAIDVEETNGLTKEQITADVNAFRAEFTRLSGQNVMIYISAGQIDNYFTADIDRAPLWVADYCSPHLHFPRKMSALWDNWVMYQYSESETWPGIQQDNGGGIDADRATSAIFLNKPQTTQPSTSTPATQPTQASSDVYRTSLPYAVNSRAGADFDVLDRYGNRVAGHEVSKGDRICIIGVDYDRQLAEIVYPVKGGYMHGYIHNREDLLHNSGYNAWQNGRTKEIVYNAAGQRIGSINPYERATVLHSHCVLYSTAKGGETKSGYVRYVGR